MPDDEDFEYEITLKWTRTLYDYFREQLGITPAIVDSGDAMYRTKAVTDQLCALYGLDPDGVKEMWDPVPEEYWPKSEAVRATIGHMLASAAAGFEKQTAKWREEYWNEVADGLRKRVESEMPVCEYLTARKLRL